MAFYSRKRAVYRIGNKACPLSVFISKTTPAGVWRKPSDLSGPKASAICQSLLERSLWSLTMSLACCTSRTKEWERTETSDLEDSNLPITGQQQKTHLLKAIL